MKINKLFLVGAILLFVQIVVAQKINKTIQLNWNDKSIIENRSDKNVILPLLENQFFDENYMPYYFEQWKVADNIEVNQFEIKNIVYQNLDKKLYPKETQKYFTETLISNFEIKRDRNNAYAQLKLRPLVLKSGQLKKIVSFELEYTIKQKTGKIKYLTVHDSPLASGKWYKFAIDTTGVFKLDKSFLNSIGVSTNSINPKNIQLYGNGGARIDERNSVSKYDGLQENAIYVNGEDDGSFDSNDYILFYGQGPDIWIPNLALNKAKHQKNIYSDKAYYFLHVGNETGKRIALKTPITSEINQTITKFNDFGVHELEKINLDSFGQQFFGENFTVNDTQNFTINFNDIDLTSNIDVRLAVATVTLKPSTFQLNYNNETLININNGVTTATGTVGSLRTASYNFTATNDVLDFEVVFDNMGNPSAKAYLDYIEVNGKKKLIARDKQFSFRSFDLANSNAAITAEIVIENKENIFQIWDVSDKINPIKIENISTNNTYTFIDNGGNGVVSEYIVLNNSDYYRPIKLSNSNVANQNLHAIRDIDYLIITKEELLDQANRLANYHKVNNNLNTLVLTEQVIYNEFSSGAKDPMAIRGFIKHLYDNASTVDKRIKYVLMFGDTSFDYQNIEGHNNGTNVIAYQSYNSTSLIVSYVTDDFFVVLDDNEGEFINTNGAGDLIDVAIGRMPVRTNDEAKSAVNKTLNYYHKNAFGNWRNNIALVADDFDKGEAVFVTNLEGIYTAIDQRNPAFNVKKIYADAYVQQISSGGESYPQVNSAIDNAIERGVLVVDYFGHGGENGWSEERLLDVPQIKKLYNPNTLPLFITITCEFSRFDNPNRFAAGESLFANKNGGSINMITTSREVYISFGNSFNLSLMKEVLKLYTNDDFSIAASLNETKNINSNNVQRLFITYFGDPAMKLAIPKKNIKITHMNDVEISQELDTIKALSHVYFKGIVTDANNNLVPNFNGELSVAVYDKATSRFTLDNDNKVEPIQFTVRESKIFNGKATVENGNWQFDFIAPRDIRIANGTAKLSFYAESDTSDKNGYSTDVIIGGINYDAPDDDIGPKIKLFMNDESFIDGGNTNESPLFLAFLEDDSGINTSFTAVDHDIIGILDGDQSNPIIMNDYYETEADNFKKGIVKFPLKNLSVGIHTLTFKCWDTYNNPSESSLSFVVVSDAELVLDNVLNYPNPFINHTQFWFNHNKPNENLEVQVQIFTISGKLIKTINESIITTGLLSRTINWNGLDDFGNKIGKGVYIYKLKVKVSSSGLKAEKTEKLVILQ